jgi:UDP-N-acetylglucosamine:LPS N-acetylglucosamine transferase
MRVALVGSSGGHLAQLLVLRPWWEKHDRFWVTFDTPDAVESLDGERVTWCYHPTNRHAWNLVRNTLLAVRVLARERPSVIVSTGAAVAVPFFVLGRLLGSRTIYIEVVDRIDSPTVTGRLVRRFTDEMLVQWAEQESLYPGSRVIGRLM